MRQTNSRILESIVPKEYKKTFSLYQEEEPQFSLSSSPKKPEEGMEQPEAQAPLATSPAPADAPPVEDKPAGKDQSTWLVKKLVGLLRYAGAMAIEVRGAVPDEALEIIDKLQDELENIAASLDPFVTTKQAEEEPEEPEAAPEEETEQMPDEQPAV